MPNASHTIRQELHYILLFIGAIWAVFFLSYIFPSLDRLGVTVDAGEVRRLTNAILLSKGRAVDERLLVSSSELRLARRWVGQGLVDALPFGSSLGKTSARAAGRIDRSDLPRLVALLRDGPAMP